MLQALHVGFFVALAALVVYWITLNRTTLGYEVRAVGFNPEAAHYGGISVARNYFLAMAISGLFAGLAGAIDIVGWAYRMNTNDVMISSRSPSSGSPSRCSAATRRSGSGSAPSLRVRSSPGPDGNSTPRSKSRSSREPDRI